MQIEKKFAACLLIILAVATFPVLGSIINSISIPSSGIIGLSSVDPLHTSGIYIYNSTGGRVNLHAVCFQHGAQGEAITATDIAKVKSMGFNCFRIFLYWGEIQTDPVNATAISQSFFTTNAGSYPGLDTLVNWAVKYGVYLILTLTFNEWHLPPAWSFKGVSFTGQGEYNYNAWNYLFDGTRVGGVENQGINAVWQYIVNRYKNVPNIIIELFNEVNWSTNATAAYFANYKALCGNIIAAIDQQEVTSGSVSHLKCVMLPYEDPAWQEMVDSRSVDISGTNVVWTFHPYQPQTWNGPDVLNDYITTAFTLKSNILHQLYLAGKMTHDFPAGNYTAGGASQNYTEALWVAWRIARVADRVQGVWNKPLLDTEGGKIATQPAFDVWVDIECGMKRDYGIAGWTWFCYCSLASGAGTSDYYNINNPTYGPTIMAALTPWLP